MLEYGNDAEALRYKHDQKNAWDIVSKPPGSDLV
jgi:hypothetical protein